MVKWEQEDDNMQCPKSKTQTTTEKQLKQVMEKRKPHLSKYTK